MRRFGLESFPVAGFGISDVQLLDLLPECELFLWWTFGLINQQRHSAFRGPVTVRKCITPFIWFCETNLTTELFHQPTLMHTFFIHLQYVCYIIILNMFRALTCPSSGGKFVFTQHLVSSLFQSEDTRCCVNTNFSPEDGHVNARNMSRIIV